MTALQYADDIALYTTKDRLTYCKIDIERAVAQLERRFIYLRLDLEPSKTNIMVFNNKDDRENRLRCRIAGQRIGNARSVKFLGIVFDSKMKFNKPLTHVHEKTLKAIIILKFICRVS